MSSEGGRGDGERAGPPRAAKWFLTPVVFLQALQSYLARYQISFPILSELF
jgi:hypothetical protein